MAVASVSVVIPAYNYVHVLPDAIDSALQQTLSPLEILVIDDGTTDNTAQVVAGRFGHNPLVRYIHQSNAGLSAARNTGIENARGEFVGFLDADDLWKPDFLAEILARFARLPSEFALVSCCAQVVNIAREPLAQKPPPTRADHEFTVADILFKTRFAPSATVVRRRVFQEVGGFDPTLRSSEDRDMWIRIALRHRILRSSQQLVIVRRHRNSMSTHTDRMKENIGRVLAKTRRNPEVPPLGRFFWLRVFSYFRYQTAWMYHEENRRGAALRELLLSLLIWPWFLHSRAFNEPAFFRIRTVFRFGSRAAGPLSPQIRAGIDTQQPS